MQILRPGAKPKAVRRERPAGEAPSNGSKPCLLNDKTEAKICEYLRSGASLVDASVMTGVGESTVTDWRRRGVEDPESRFGLFLERTDEARTAWKTRAIRKITESSDWKASWKLLCARFPHEFRNFMNVNAELTGADGGPMQVMGGGGFNVVLELHDKSGQEQEKEFTVR